MSGREALARLGARLLRTRWFVRAPVTLFRVGLGAVFGSRLLLLEHRGRVSGRLRQVVLECVDRPDPRTVFVASGFGASAQWYRNVVVDPRVRVSVGLTRRRPARAVVLDETESRTMLAGYARRHEAAFRALTDMLATAAGDGGAVDIRIVRLDLDGRR